MKFSKSFLKFFKGDREDEFSEEKSEKTETETEIENVSDVSYEDLPFFPGANVAELICYMDRKGYNLDQISSRSSTPIKEIEELLREAKDKDLYEKLADNLEIMYRKAGYQG
jgi:hypothetical protein